MEGLIVLPPPHAVYLWREVTMRERLLQELTRISARVEMGVILEDLAFLDMDASLWPPEIRRRALAQGLYRRKFFDRLEDCYAVTDLWIQVKEYFGLTHPHFVRLLTCELEHYDRTAPVSVAQRE